MATGLAACENQRHVSPVPAAASAPATSNDDGLDTPNSVPSGLPSINATDDPTTQSTGVMGVTHAAP